MAKKNYCVIGLGKFGTQLATRLKELGNTVMVVDYDEKTVQKASLQYNICFNCDATDVNALKDIGVEAAGVVIVATCLLKESILICSNLIEIGIKEIIARASNSVHERILKNMGVKTVVFPEIEAADKLALQCSYNLSGDMLEIGDGISWIKTVITNSNFLSIPLVKLNIRETIGASIVMIEREGKQIFPLTKDTFFQRGDIATVMCKTEDIEVIVKNLSKDTFQ